MASKQYTPQQIEQMYKDATQRSNKLGNEINSLLYENANAQISTMDRQRALSGKSEEDLSLEEIDARIAAIEQKKALEKKPESELSLEEIDARIAAIEAKQKDKSMLGQVERLLETTKRPSNTPYPDLDKEFAQKFAKVSKIADFPIGEGHTITSALLQQVYGPAGLEVIPKDGGQYELRDKFTQETYTPDTVNALGQLGSIATAVGLGIPTAIATAPLGPGAVILGEGAVSAGQETAELTKAAMEAKKLGLVPSVGDVIGKKKGQIALAGGLGAGAGALGEAITGLPGALKGMGGYFQRAGTRGEIEKDLARQLLESSQTENILNTVKGKEFGAGQVIIDLVKRRKKEADDLAESYFSQVRNAPDVPENRADIKNWFSAFSNKIQGSRLDDGIFGANTVIQQIVKAANPQEDIIAGSLTVTPNGYLNMVDTLKQQISNVEAMRSAPGVKEIGLDELYKNLNDGLAALENPLRKNVAKAVDNVEDLAGTGAFTKVGFSSTPSPRLPESSQSFTGIKLGYNAKDEYYSKVPKIFRELGALNDPELVQRQLFTKGGESKITRQNAKQMQKILSAQEKEAISQSYLAWKVGSAPKTVENSLFTNVPSTALPGAKAALKGPQAQKELQKQGADINFVKLTEGMTPEEVGYGFKAKSILDESRISDDTVQALIGKNSLRNVNRPLEELSTYQTTKKGAPQTAVQKIKELGEKFPWGGRRITSDTGIGVGLGSLAGASVGYPLGGYPGAAIGAGTLGIAGGLIGNQIRPIARATGETLQQVPESLIQAAQSPIARTATQAIMQGGRSAIQNPEAFNFDEEELSRLKFSPTSAASQLLQGFRR
jgi:hypothetical protein